MFTTKFLRVPGGFLLAAAPLKEASDNDSKNESDNAHYTRRRSELPLYTPLHAQNKPSRNVPVSHDHDRRLGVAGNIENAVRVVRMEVQTGLSAFEKQKESIMDVVNTAKSHTQSSIDYLNQPHNILPRTGAIAMGGLAGFIFAARGGFFKKLLYTSFGAGGMASLCYPQQASVFARDALYEARKGYAIAYNFVKGVKPGDEIPLEPINKFPTNLEDIKLMLWDLYDETVDTLFPKKS